jgi:superfamily II RNA helicase
MSRRPEDKNHREKRRRQNEKARSDTRGKRPRGNERFDKHELADGGNGRHTPKHVPLAVSHGQRHAVEELLSGIGTPEPQPLVPDPFQIEALEAINTQDVLVTAPTGSGKTWIAREEIRRLLEAGKRAWYTTPLKALTNSKYQEFGQEFGFENVGILTGDRKENWDAPLIVGTTEIYRNQLFDALRQGEQVRTDFVILDEAHYLGDQDRGHVWEEAIILSPPRIRLLLLSATIGNADEFAQWIEEIRGTKVRVINRAGTRPVELRAAFLSEDLQLFPLYDEAGKFNAALYQFSPQRREESTGYRSRRRF